MLWVMFCWETLCLGIHVNIILTHTAYLNIVEDVHPFMAMVFTGGSGLFQQDIAFCHKNSSTIVWGIWPCCLGIQISQLTIWLSTCGLCCKNKSMEFPHCNLNDLKDSLLTPRHHPNTTGFCHIRGLVKSMPQHVRAVLVAQGGPIRY